MTNIERAKAFEAIAETVELYKSGVKGSSGWCLFAQGSNKLRSKWKFRLYKSLWYIGIIAIIYYLLK